MKYNLLKKFHLIMCEEEEWYEIFDHDIDDEEFNKVNKIFNTEEYPQKSYDPQMTKLSVYTKEYCGTKKPPKMTKVYVAPKLKQDRYQDYAYIKQQEWCLFIRSVESNKLYKLTDLVKLYNETMKPPKKLNNRSFGQLKYAQDSFIKHKFFEKGKIGNQTITYYIKK